jgi:hypothetical protein
MSKVTDKSTFDKLYYASLWPEVAALVKLQPSSDERVAGATRLARAGATIDHAIMVDGWDPFVVMTARVQYNMPWVPSLLQSPLGAPNGIALPGVGTQPGQTAYDPKRPPIGSIKVSLDSDAYPPFAPVVAPPPVIKPTSAVGLDEGFGYFGASVLARELYDTGQLSDGQDYTSDPRGTFVFHATDSPFAPEHKSLWFSAKK